MVDDTKEFTLMFYFASDNPLAISVVSQLKAIKAAGFHKQANVIVQFDPFTEGTPTHIFDVNLIDKLKSKRKCDEDAHKGSLVLNLIDDKLWNGERTRKGEFVSKAMREFIEGYDPPHPPNGRETIDGKSLEFGPQRSLDRFLEFCSYAYPAKHYLLFILGHGVVVGNDVFLFDENGDENSLKLGTLGTVLQKFSEDVKLGGGQFDLIGFHSCSVASIEVAYELKDTARYMLASQGTAFVGSWPYKQILGHVFKELKVMEKSKRNKKKQQTDHFTYEAMRLMGAEMFSFCMQNSTDFLLAGYPFDLSLFDLSKISTIKQPFDKLSQALVEGLKDAHCTDLITLAHWKSQSFYQEMYTDLYDFCFCLKQKLEDYRLITKGATDLIAACDDVMKALDKNTEEQMNSQGEKFIVCSEFAGPEYQYAHGLSVYFPWSRPPADRRLVEEYKEYKISGAGCGTTWIKFLEAYWLATRRKPRKAEQQTANLQGLEALFEDRISLVYTQEGPRDGQNALDSRRAKIDPRDPLGGDAGISIKNFPNDIRDRSQTKPDENPFSLSEAFLP